MEFDKSKILTVVTADQAKVGQKGWFGETPSALEKRVEKEPPKVLESVWLSGDRRYIFRTNDDSWSLFYPAPEPTYAERQAEWVKENNVKAGTKVRVTRTFTSYEDGCNEVFVPLKGTFIGDDCTVDVIYDTCIIVRSKQKDDWWRFPYFVLEVVPEEPWFKLGDKVRITIKSSEAYNKIGTVTDTHVHRDGTQTVYLSFEEFRNTKAFNADSKEKIGELYQPTYAERQEEWIRKHNLKEGDKVLILKKASSQENGWPNSWTVSMDSKVGNVFTYVRTSGNGIRLSCGYEWPYFVLEVIKEPTYRPFNNNELNDLVGEVLTSKFSGRRKLVTGRPKQKTQVNLDGKPFTAEILLQYYYRNTDEPCGIREDD